jgi:hypothetical protein
MRDEMKMRAANQRSSLSLPLRRMNNDRCENPRLSKIAHTRKLTLRSAFITLSIAAGVRYFHAYPANEGESAHWPEPVRLSNQQPRSKH